MSKPTLTMMRAKIIFYEEASDAFPDRETPAAYFIPAADKDALWQLSADHLTSGEVAELLLYLDELGFTDHWRSGQKLTNAPMSEPV